jgi:hypothetical protein
MPDYQDAKIYKIVNYENDDVYIGSTCEPTLARRLAKHVGNYKTYLNGKGKYYTSFKIIETDNYDIQLIEAYPCNNKMELHAREGYYIKSMDCVNRCVAGRTQTEYYQDNKKMIAKYYQDSKEMILKQQKEYRKANKDIISIKHKDYYEDSKEMILKQKKAYYKANKEIISEKLSKQYECICGAKFTLWNKSRHMRTARHQSYINSIDYLQDIHKYVMNIIKKYK